MKLRFCCIILARKNMKSSLKMHFFKENEDANITFVQQLSSRKAAQHLFSVATTRLKSGYSLQALRTVAWLITYDRNDGEVDEEQEEDMIYPPTFERAHLVKPFFF